MFMDQQTAYLAKREAYLAKHFVDKKFGFMDDQNLYNAFVEASREKFETVGLLRHMLENLRRTSALQPLRLYDAGVGNFEVGSGLLQAVADRFPGAPRSYTGQEIRIADIKQTFDKLPDRFFDAPTVITLTNQNPKFAPWLSAGPANDAHWEEVSLKGRNSYQIKNELEELGETFVAKKWKMKAGDKGGPSFEKPAVLVLFRETEREVLGSLIPQKNVPKADYDFEVGSNMWKIGRTPQFKAKNSMTTLCKALGPGGLFVAITAYGEDVGHEIIRKFLPEPTNQDNRFYNNRFTDIAEATKIELETLGIAGQFNFSNPEHMIYNLRASLSSDDENVFLGDSLTKVALTAGAYTGQLSKEEWAQIIQTEGHMHAVSDVVRRNGGRVRFQDEYLAVQRYNFG